jgi:hypothetical protein
VTAFGRELPFNSAAALKSSASSTAHSHDRNASLERTAIPATDSACQCYVFLEKTLFNIRAWRGFLACQASVIMSFLA